MKRFWLIPSLALMVGMAVGYAFRKNAVTPVTPAVSTTTTSGSRAHDGRATTPRSMSGPPASDSLDACRSRSRTGRIRSLSVLYSDLDTDGFTKEATRIADLPLDERFLASFLLYGRWAETDPVAALAMLNAMGRKAEPFLPVLLQCWANTDPAAAAAFYQENPDRFNALLDMGGGHAAAHIAAEWTRNDPEAALTWAKSLAGDARDAALGSVVRELSGSDPARAWGIVSTITGGRQADSYAEISRAWGAVDYAGAERQINAISDISNESRSRLLAATVIGLSRDNPRRAADKLVAFPLGSERDGAIWAVVTNQLAGQDAGAAAHWIMNHAAEAGRNDYLTRVIPQFVRQDAMAARSFAESLPPGRTHDWAVARYVIDALEQGKGTRAELAAMTERIADAEIHAMAARCLRQE